MNLIYDNLLFVKYFTYEKTPKALLVYLCIIIGFSGCRCNTKAEYRLTKEQILEIASKEIVKRGYDLNKFHAIYDENHQGSRYLLERVRENKILETRFGYLLKLKEQDYGFVVFGPAPFPGRLGVTYNVIIDLKLGKVIDFFEWQ